MVRIRQLPFVLLIPFGLAGVAQANTPSLPEITGGGVVAAQTPAAEPAPAPVQIEIPRLEGIVGAPSPDLLPPVAEPARTAAPAVEQSPAQAVAAPVVSPVFTLAQELAERIAKEKSSSVSKDDRDAALKFYEARQGKPLWVSETGLNSNAQALITEISKAADWGLAADAFMLPGTPGADASKPDLADAEATLTLTAMKYARHARGGRIDPTALSKAIDRKAQVLPAAKVLETLAEASAPDAALRGFHPQHPQFEKLRQKYVAVRAGAAVFDTPPAAVETDPVKGKKVAASAAKPLSPAAIERKLLANMEMYRWMPDFGRYYIQPNIPEFMVRVVKDGKVIHAERIVTGKPETMTPTFSDALSLVVFKPFWNVPESIKYKELQPQLLRSGGALARAGLKAEINGRVVDPTSVDWIDVDMRQVHIFQPPGEANALGKVKFRFPNKHDVYLHDTPSKSLFANSSRAFSHGCVRVRDPLKLAEVILANDKNMTRADVDRLANNGPENNELKLASPIPIHLTYFTAWVDDDGKLQTASDIYGHESRVHLGLEGKTHLIAQPREEKFNAPSAEDRRRFAEARRDRQQSADPVGGFFKSIFNF